MTVTQEEKTYQARFLTRSELVAVTAHLLRPGYSLFYEDHDPCLVMLDFEDQPCLWANGLLKIPYSFKNEKDFWGFCREVAEFYSRTSRSTFGAFGTLTAKTRLTPPKNLAYIFSGHIRIFY